MAIEAVDNLDESKDVPINDVCGCFALDCIGQIICSVDFQAVKDPNNDLIKRAKNFFNMPVFVISAVAPKVSLFFGLSIINQETKKYFTDLSSNVVEQR